MMGDEEDGSQAQLDARDRGSARRRAQGGPPRQRPPGPGPRPRPPVPGWRVISVGADNDYGHPAPVADGAAARLRDAGRAHRPGRRRGGRRGRRTSGHRPRHGRRPIGDRLVRVTTYSFSQVDVFGSGALTGNPVAVVHDATGLDDDQMAAFARWTNLSETTFLLPPEDPGADYRLRIFTPGEELPVRRPPDAGQCPRLARRPGERPPASDGHRAGVRRRARRAAPRRRGASPSVHPTSCAAARSTRTRSAARSAALGVDPGQLVGARTGSTTDPAGSGSSWTAPTSCSRLRAGLRRPRGLESA